MQTNNAIKETAKRIGSSATFKLITICALILVLLIPTSMVTSLIHERKGRKQGVIDEINYKWGRAQTVTGPVISIPYLKYIEGGGHNLSRSTFGVKLFNTDWSP